MKNNLKNLFLFLMILSTLFLMSSSSWFNLWIWLEINLLTFISFILNKNKKLSIESSLIYFFIQTIASIMFLFTILMFFYNLLFFSIMILSILLKLGNAPLHFWLPLMIKGMNWKNIFFLLTLQKINPLIIMSYIFSMKFLFLFILLSLIIGSLGSYNFSCLKKIISFSSINQLSWMILSLIYNKIFKIYIFFYFLMMYFIIFNFKFLNIKYINQMLNLNLNNFNMKLFILMNLLSLGGLPPFLGFFPKMIMIFKLNNNIMMFFMIMFSLLMLFIYFRIIFSMFMLNSIKINLFKKMKNFKNMKLILYFSFFNNLLMILIIFF